MTGPVGNKLTGFRRGQSLSYLRVTVHCLILLMSLGLQSGRLRDFWRETVLLSDACDLEVPMRARTVGETFSSYITFIMVKPKTREGVV